MDKVRARTDDMLIVRGTNVFPSQVEDVLAAVHGVTPHYRIVLDNETGMDRMTVMVELKPEAFSDSFEEMDRFRHRVVDRLKQTLLMTPVVKLVEPGGIERSFGKSKRVEDRREKS
jgi:phenylacetate-CoA ligase